MLPRVLAAAALALTTLISYAEPVSVVKVLSFGCPVCRAAEAMDSDIGTAVRRGGGKFAYAALPADATNLNRELAYYAARDLGAEEAARNSLYKGSQDYGLTFSDPVQAVVWLQDDAGINGSQLGGAIGGEPARQALGRAVRLAARAGVQKLPAYLLLRDGEVLSVMSADGVGSLFALKKRVVEEVSTYNSQEASK